MNGTPTRAKSHNRRVPDHRCPDCGMASPAVLAALPSGRKALIEACAVCGRQKVTPIDESRAAALLQGPAAAQAAAGMT